MSDGGPLSTGSGWCDWWCCGCDGELSCAVGDVIASSRARGAERVERFELIENEKKNFFFFFFFFFQNKSKLTKRTFTRRNFLIFFFFIIYMNFVHPSRLQRIHHNDAAAVAPPNHDAQHPNHDAQHHRHHHHHEPPRQSQSHVSMATEAAFSQVGRSALPAQDVLSPFFFPLLKDFLIDFIDFLFRLNFNKMALRRPPKAKTITSSTHPQCTPWLQAQCIQCSRLVRLLPWTDFQSTAWSTCRS
jgi:hypothetical protein